jgi:hypothetical protein
MPKVTTRTNCAYLHSDGTLITIKEMRLNHSVIGEAAEVTLGYAKPFWGDEVGRVVIHESQLGIIPLLRGAQSEFYLNNASEKTRQLGIIARTWIIHTKAGTVQLSDFPGVWGGGATIQDSDSEPKPSSCDWYLGAKWGHSATVTKITDLRQKDGVVIESAAA